MEREKLPFSTQDLPNIYTSYKTITLMANKELAFKQWTGHTETFNADTTKFYEIQYFRK